MNNRNYFDTVQHMQQLKTFNEIHAVTRSLLNGLSIKNFKYSWQPSPHLLNAPQQSMVSCPKDWMKHYQSKKFAKKDPKLLYIKKSLQAVIWDANTLRNNADKQTQQYWNDSLDFGLGYGITIPITSPLGGDGMLCTSLPNNANNRKDILLNLSSIVMFSHHLQLNIERLLIDNSTEIKYLTKREIEIIKWTAYGKTADEAGQILSISYTTVLFHLNNAKKNSTPSTNTSSCKGDCTWCCLGCSVKADAPD